MPHQPKQGHPPPAAPSLETLRAALWETRLTLTLLSLLLVTLAGAVLYALLATPSLPVNQEQLIAEAKERVMANADEILEEVSTFAAEAVPPVTHAFANRVRADLPLYVRALENQSDELVEGLEEQLRQRVRAQVDDYVDAHRDVFREVFPEIADEQTVDRILRDYKQTLRRLAERYYLDDFRRQAQRTVRLWKSLEPVEPPRKGTLEDQLLEYTGDWLALQLKEAAEEGVGLTAPDRKP